MTSSRLSSSRRLVGTVVPVLALLLVASACSGGRRYRPLFGWSSVPACQAAIRSRAFSEFGNVKVDFDGPADETRIGDGRVRVTGTGTIERKKRDDIPIRYECVTKPKRSRLVSAKYSRRD